MPYVPGVVDSTGDDPASQAQSSPPGGAVPGGSLQEAYQLMALNIMHRMGGLGKQMQPEERAGAASRARGSGRGRQISVGRKL